jgi:hypothetical protein
MEIILRPVRSKDCRSSRILLVILQTDTPIPYGDTAQNYVMPVNHTRKTWLFGYRARLGYFAAGR